MDITVIGTRYVFETLLIAYHDCHTELTEGRKEDQAEVGQPHLLNNTVHMLDMTLRNVLSSWPANAMHGKRDTHVKRCLSNADRLNGQRELNVWDNSVQILRLRMTEQPDKITSHMQAQVQVSLTEGG